MMVLRIPMLFGVKQSPALRGTALSQGHAPRRVIASLELEHYQIFEPFYCGYFQRVNFHLSLNCSITMLETL